MLWLRLALLGVVLTTIAGATFKVTSFLHEKDKAIADREQQMQVLNARVAGLLGDKARLEQSNATLEQEVNRKRDELMRAQVEAKRLSLTDQASNKRLTELEQKLQSQERSDKLQRLKRSDHAELVLKVVNNSAKCEVENFFRTGGQCKSGKWVDDGGRLVPKAEQAAKAQGVSDASPAPEAQHSGESHADQ